MRAIRQPSGRQRQEHAAGQQAGCQHEAGRGDEGADEADGGQSADCRRDEGYAGIQIGMARALGVRDEAEKLFAAALARQVRGRLPDQPVEAPGADLADQAQRCVMGHDPFAVTGQDAERGQEPDARRRQGHVEGVGRHQPHQPGGGRRRQQPAGQGQQADIRQSRQAGQGQPGRHPPADWPCRREQGGDLAHAAALSLADRGRIVPSATESR